MPLERRVMYFRFYKVNNTDGNLTLNNKRKTNNFDGNNTFRLTDNT